MANERLKARLLLQSGLAVLWMQLLPTGQLQLSSLVIIPALLLISRWPALPQRRMQVLTLSVLACWGLASAGLDGRPLLTTLANLFWLLAGLKLVEAREGRPIRLVALILLIGIALAGVISQSLVASLLQGLAALLSISGLIAAEAGPQPLRILLRDCLSLVALALPLVISAFLLLPRLPPLWTLPSGVTARSGLSDQLNPGDLSELALSSELAARLFVTAPELPPPSKRYWRVLVLDRFDRGRWRAAPISHARKPMATIATPAGETRTWLLEPSALSQVPWDGEGQPLVTSLTITARGELQAEDSIRSRFRYRLTGPRITTAGSPWRQQPPTGQDLQWPKGRNPRLDALAQQWRHGEDDPLQIVNLARRWFLDHPFRYTLQPGALPTTGGLDAFLFQSRAGFCGHYASAFTGLMRAAGVPARVVVGYQGGRWVNPLTGQAFLELTNSDAHAWAEIWDSERGWLRVDPTAWIAPERSRSDLFGSLPESERPLLAAGGLERWLRPLADQWRGLDNQWQRWVMGFDAEAQRRLLLQWLPLGIQNQGLFAVLTIGGLLIPVVLLTQRLPTGQREDKLRRALERCLAVLKRRGWHPQDGETLRAFCQRLSQEQPQLQEILDQLEHAYNQLRFAPQPSGHRRLKGHWQERQVSRHLRKLQHRIRHQADGHKQ